MQERNWFPFFFSGPSSNHEHMRMYKGASPITPALLLRKYLVKCCWPHWKFRPYFPFPRSSKTHPLLEQDRPACSSTCPGERAPKARHHPAARDHSLSSALKKTEVGVFKIFFLCFIVTIYFFMMYKVYYPNHLP